jgi:hypothetical protein
MSPDRLLITRDQLPTILAKVFATMLGAVTGLSLAAATVFVISLGVWWSTATN